MFNNNDDKNSYVIEDDYHDLKNFEVEINDPTPSSLLPCNIIWKKSSIILFAFTYVFSILMNHFTVTVQFSFFYIFLFFYFISVLFFFH